MDEDINRKRQIPEEFIDLFQRANAGDIDPAEFLAELDHSGVSGFLKMIYLGQAYGWPLQRVKEMYITEQYGSVEKWSEEIAAAIHEHPDENIDDLDTTISERERLPSAKK